MHQINLTIVFEIVLVYRCGLIVRIKSTYDASARLCTARQFSTATDCGGLDIGRQSVNGLSSAVNPQLRAAPTYIVFLRARLFMYRVSCKSYRRDRCLASV